MTIVTKIKMNSEQVGTKAKEYRRGELCDFSEEQHHAGLEPLVVLATAG